MPPELAGLPWETLPGPAGRAVALHPLVSINRKADAATERLLPGPLRIVVAITAPMPAAGPVLDYERELRNMLVREGRTGCPYGSDIPDDPGWPTGRTGTSSGSGASSAAGPPT